MKGNEGVGLRVYPFLQYYGLPFLFLHLLIAVDISCMKEEIERLIKRLEAVEGEVSHIKEELRQLIPVEKPEEKVQSYFEPKEDYSLDDFQVVSAPALSTATPSGIERPLTDYISVIDYFRYKRELFGDDPEEMRRALEEMSRLGSAVDFQHYLVDVYHMDMEREEVRDFYELLRPHFD